MNPGARQWYRVLQRLVDLGALSIAWWLALLIRFDWEAPPLELRRHLFLWPYVMALQYGAMLLFGVHRFSWRYVGLREARRIGGAAGAAAAVLVAARIIGARLLPSWGGTLYVIVPFGVIAADAMLAFLGAVGVRALRRMQLERAKQSERRVAFRASARESVPTLLVGAGRGGLTVAKELEARPDLGIQPVGFLDDDPDKMGSLVHGIPVLGVIDSCAELAAQTGAREALVTISNVPRQSLRRIVDLAEEAGLRVKVLPEVADVASGKVSLSDIRPVAIEDLLGREAVELDEASLASFVRDRTVMVTGAGGSIGSELCRQIVRFGAAKLVLVERYENSLFAVGRELADEECEVTPVVADVQHPERLGPIFARYLPDVVIHAAAHKHVPLMEENPLEAIRNNVMGTRNVADLAHEFGAKHFVLISTDKAVNPTSVMGLTKRVAELYVQACASERPQTNYVAVRFGNVLGSNGSVVPIFREQIQRGGPVTVTHPDMTRYFMTIPEACRLVLQAASIGAGGEVFILDMGEPVKIVDLARDMIRLSGLEPNVDVDIEFVGTRPGEKLFEELSTKAEEADRTKHPKIFVGKVARHSFDGLSIELGNLEAICGGSASSTQRWEDIVFALVPEYCGERSKTSRRGQPAA